ncbi:hypothetical protein PI126_g6432 [Phytophthora idaei]|nr:hypothetical protein PI126_g6432 [Phytophthora idaei]
MVSKHGKHPIGMAEKAKLAKRARHQLESAPGYLNQRVNQSAPQEPAITKRGALQRLWCPAPKALNAHIAHWLINDGLPYNTVATEDFRILIELVTGNTTILAKVKVRITSRTEALYRIDSEAMAQFTMSDTAPSAHKVSKIFEDSLPTDCTMHVMSLQYGMDMRKNYETVYVVGPDTNKQKLERSEELNNYFNSPQRVERLTMVQQFYDLPELSPIVDCDTRVAYSATLFQRTIINYSTVKAYFQHCESYDDAGVFSKLTFADWRLLAEMEAITQSLADLALIDVQRSNQVSSELIVLMKFTLDRLATSMFHVCELETTRSPKTNEHSFPRHDAHIDTFFAVAKICVNRIKGQIPHTKFTVDDLVQPAALGVTTASDNASDDAAAAAAIDNVIRESKRALCKVHRDVFCVMHAADSSNTLDTEVDTPPNLDLVPPAGNELVMCGSPLTASATTTTPVMSLDDQADEDLKKWYQHTVNWFRVAVQQVSDDKLTVEDFTRLLLVRR